MPSGILLEAAKKGINIYLKGDQLAFNAPKGVLDPELKEKIIENKLQIIEFLKINRNSSYIKNIEKSSKNSQQLSYARQRMWLLSEIEGVNAYYNMPSALKLSGTLNYNALNRTIASILDRHETLRSSIVVGENGEPQVIVRNVPQDLCAIVDFSDLNEEEKTIELNKLIDSEVNRPFDLAKEIMLRSQLLKMEDEVHVLLLTMHHIASDGWSIGVLIDDFCQLYSAYSQDKKNPLDPLLFNYADFTLWQHQYIASDASRRQLGYWEKKLTNAPSFTELGFSNARPKVINYDASRVNIYINEIIYTNILALCKKYNVSTFMVLLGALKILIARYSGARDILVGTATANRARAEFEKIIGYFVNTLALRTQIKFEDTFEQVLNNVRDTCIEAYDHQDVSFESVIEHLKTPRSLNFNPLVQILLILQNIHHNDIALPGLNVAPLTVEKSTTTFDITIDLSEKNNAISGYLTYIKSLYDHSDITLFANTFVEMLDRLTKSPEIKINELIKLNQCDTNSLSDNDYLIENYQFKNKTLNKVFEEQVDLTPNAIAIFNDDAATTYSQLDQKANQLAHYLILLGVKPASIVAISLERSVDCVATILAILKIGACYLPLDHKLPAKRIQEIFDDAKPIAYIYSSKLISFDVGCAPLIAMDIDSCENIIASQSCNRLNFGMPSITSAYLIYTSGSSGVPKGVLNSHHAVINNSMEIWSQYPKKDADVVAFKTSIGFVASVQEIFSTILIGSKLFIVNDEVYSNFNKLHSAIADNKITQIFISPSVLSALLEAFLVYPKEFEFASIKYLFTGGELVNKHLIYSIRNMFPNAVIINSYGFTESVGDASAFKVNESFYIEHEGGIPYSKSKNNLPIGKPVFNMEMYVLDKELNECPVNVVGEIYVSGESLAFGYLNRPRLTAEAFIPNPYAKVEGSRLYKTGDLGRKLLDGNIECIGRMDRQIKIRGIRVELGEIEAALSKYSLVSNVVCRLISEPREALVAYLIVNNVSERNEADIVEELKCFAKDALPDYMLPQHFFLLDRYPVTVNGKLDLFRLPVLPVSNLDQDTIAPVGSMEQLLIGIWSEVLRVDIATVTRSFFDLGGNSLLLSKVHFFVTKKIDANISLVNLFEYPTIRSFAQFLENKKSNENPVNKGALDRKMMFKKAIQRNKKINETK